MEWIRTALGLVLSGHAGYCVVRVAYRLFRRKGAAGLVFLDNHHGFRDKTSEEHALRNKQYQRSLQNFECSNCDIVMN